MAPSMSERFKQASAEAENEPKTEKPEIDTEIEKTSNLQGDNGNGVSKIDQIQQGKFLKAIINDMSIEKQTMIAALACDDFYRIFGNQNYWYIFENSYYRAIYELAMDLWREYGEPPRYKIGTAVFENHNPETAEGKMIMDALLAIQALIDSIPEKGFNQNWYIDQAKKYFTERLIRLNIQEVERLFAENQYALAIEQSKKTFDFNDIDSKSRKLEILHASEQVIKDYDFIITHLIVSNINFGIVGPTGSDKTLLIIDAVLSCAFGINTCHGFGTKQGWSLFILGEGHDDIIRRERAWKIDRGIDKKDWDKATIAYTSQPVPITDERAFKNLCNLIDKEVKEQGSPPLMIIIDTVSRNLGHGNEMNQLMKEYGNKSNQLRVRYECSVGSIYHSLTNDKRGKYASQLEADNDVTYYMGPSKEGENIKVFEVLCPPRGFPPVKPFLVSSEVVDLGIIDPMTGEAVTSVVACNPEIEYSAEVETNSRPRKAPKRDLAMAIYTDLVEKNGNEPIKKELFEDSLKQFEICKGGDCEFKSKNKKCRYANKKTSYKKVKGKRVAICLSREQRRLILKNLGDKLGIIEDSSGTLCQKLKPKKT